MKTDPFDDSDEDQYDHDSELVDGGDHKEHCGCGRETAGEECGFCGQPLCPMCFEMGGGFCNGPHTQEMIDAYEDSLYGPADAARKRQRRARNELRQMGVL